MIHNINIHHINPAMVIDSNGFTLVGKSKKWFDYFLLKIKPTKKHILIKQNLSKR